MVFAGGADGASRVGWSQLVMSGDGWCWVILGDAGCWLLAGGCWVLRVGCWLGALGWVRCVGLSICVLLSVGSWSLGS